MSFGMMNSYSPMASVDPDTIWFPVRITVVDGTACEFQEVWLVWLYGTGVVADKIGGRVNGALDPAYAIDGSTFRVAAAGSAVVALARRASGAGGTMWELKGLPVPVDSDWFPVRITAVLAGPAFVFQEAWLNSSGLIEDRVGGRTNSAADPAYAIDGSTFATGTVGSPVQVLARRAPGASGKWELKGGGGSIYSGVTAGAVASGASGNVTVSGVGTVSVYNQWSTTIAKAKKCLIGWVANESRYQFVSVEC